MKEYKVGDVIVYPMHGAGIIMRIEESEFMGEMLRFYVLKLPVGNLTAKIPVDNCESIGVRSIVTPEKAKEIFDFIKASNIEMTSNWSQRYKDNVAKIKEGSIENVAEVVKGLFQRDRVKRLSMGERKIFVSAKQILVSELVLSMDEEEGEVSKKLEELLEQGA